MKLVKRLPVNETGTDYVIGDIHGEFARVETLLAEVQFDRTKDRLFSVGDLIDRGPDSDQCLDWLDRPWFHAVLGNHELMAMEYWASDRQAHGSLDNGGSWLLHLSDEELADYGRAFATLPAAIQIGEGDDAIGIIHGDVPRRTTWPEFLSLLEAEDQSAAMRVAYEAAWSRVRYQAARTWGLVTEVPGVKRVYVGHNPVQHPLWLANILNIDTGAVFGGPMHLIRLQDATIAATSPATRELEWH